MHLRFGRSASAVYYKNVSAISNLIEKKASGSLKITDRITAFNAVLRVNLKKSLWIEITHILRKIVCKLLVLNYSTSDLEFVISDPPKSLGAPNFDETHEVSIFVRHCEFYTSNIQGSNLIVPAAIIHDVILSRYKSFVAYHFCPLTPPR